jgi:maltose O-acetyltransferase
VVKALRSPRALFQVLKAKLQLRGCTEAPLGIRLRGHVFVENRGSIVLGERVRIEGRTVPVELVAWDGAELTVGEQTFLNYGSSLSAHEKVSIGRNCLIGSYVNILDSDYHDMLDRTQPGESAPVIIEDDVWIANRALILKGVRIGRGSVIGAGAVVTRDVPPGCFAAGVPARVIRRL